MIRWRLTVIGLVIIALVFSGMLFISNLRPEYGLGVLLLQPLIRISYVGGFFVVIYLGLGLGLAITTHFGSSEPWDFTSLLEEDSK